MLWGVATVVRHVWVRSRSVATGLSHSMHVTVRGERIGVCAVAYTALQRAAFKPFVHPGQRG